jgi:hypothetical protein
MLISVTPADAELPAWSEQDPLDDWPAPSAENTSAGLQVSMV